MLDIYCNKSNRFYYDIENKSIARFPSKSNLKSHGSDNSLYFGTTLNKEIVDIFLKIFDLNSIEEYESCKYKVRCLSEEVGVSLNVNKDGQIQIKIEKDGTMNKLSKNFSYVNMQEYDFTKMLIVVDLKEKEIRFIDPNKMLK